MKRILAVLLLAIMVLSPTACGSQQTPTGTSSASTPESSETSSPETSETPAPEASAPPAPESPDEPESTDVPLAGTNTLVVYFSMPETTNPDNMTAEEANSTVIIDGEVLGNTQFMAYVIAETTGADIFRIEPETPYTTNHADLIAFARDEQSTNARPAMAANVENLDQYDTIFIGYPNWWGDMPMILYTFFDKNDFSGKTVIPFNTHGGSGFSGTISTIAGLEPEADVSENGLTISRNRIQDAEQEIIDWVTGLGYAQ